MPAEIHVSQRFAVSRNRIQTECVNPAKSGMPIRLPDSGVYTKRSSPRQRGYGSLINGWTAMMSRLRTPGPAAAKPVATPADDGAGLHDHQRRPPVVPTSREHHPKES